MHRRAVLAGLAATGLSACSATSVWAPDDIVARKTVRGGQPPAVRLFTMKTTDGDSGAHTGLLINASQRVIFDPAGTFGHPTIPERNDVLFGITKGVEEFYISYHARITFYVVAQRLQISAEGAERILARALQAGPVPQALCARETSRVLQAAPELEWLPPTFFPDTLSRAFARAPGVETEVFRETDPDNKDVATAQYDMQLRTAQSQ